MTDEEIEEAEDLDDDFDEEDLDDDIDLDDIELEDLAEEEEEERPKRSKPSDDDLVEMDYEQALRANPKRAKAVKKRASLIETLLGEATLDSEDGIEAAWETLSKEVDTKIRKKYAIDAEFDTNQVIEHDTFGVGFVNQMLSETKVEVIFKDGIKRLVCNRTS